MFKKILGISICMICLGFSNVSAEVVTVEGNGECEFGAGTKMTIDDAMASAREKALGDASQKVAVHVKRISKSVDHIITEDKIELISSNVLSVPNEEFIFDTIDNKVFVMKCRIVANVDDNNILKQIRQNDAELDAALKRIKELEAENRKLRMKDLPREINIEADGYYCLGDGPDENAAIAKDRARADAKKQITKQIQIKAGIFIENLAKERGIVLTDDKIKIIIANVTKLRSEVIVPEIIGDSVIRYTCTISATLNMSDVIDELNKLK
ncbi:MAG: hypothetical protein IJ575_08260 [Selenomonadaceae bacterium]|nr:hypothetical protein [Selenomonadaceae bacterium]